MWPSQFRKVYDVMLLSLSNPDWKCKIHEQMFLNEKQPTEHKFSLSSFPVSICFLPCWQSTWMAEFQSFILLLHRTSKMLIFEKICKISLWLGKKKKREKSRTILQDRVRDLNSMTICVHSQFRLHRIMLPYHSIKLVRLKTQKWIS